jgi:hypothetical protein
MLSRIGCVVLTAGALSSFHARPAVIFDSGVTALTATDPLQIGRINRNGVVSDWSTQKTYPGTINTTTAYHYTTYVIPDPYFKYIQVTFDDISLGANTFASAYDNSYNPTATAPNYGLDVNYLGDGGASGNYFGSPNDPRVFQVVFPTGSNLVIVVNDTSATGAGLNQQYELIVEGFTDTNFDDSNPPAPEPAALGLSGAGLGIGGLIVLFRRRKNQGKLSAF